MRQAEKQCKVVFSLQAEFLQEVKGNGLIYLTLTIKQLSSRNISLTVVMYELQFLQLLKRLFSPIELPWHLSICMCKFQLNAYISFWDDI